MHRLIVSKFKGIEKLDILFLSLLSVLCYFVFFKNLGDYSLRMWDEARTATNALEMLRNNNFFVTYFNGRPDLWSTKPPFFLWVVVLFFKIFGVNELSLRLPSAIAASITTLGIYFFSKLLLKNRWIGLFGSLIILSSMGFSDIHIGRSGDFDAMLTLWVFLATMTTFIFVENNKNKALYAAAIFWTLAVLTKGIAGLFMLPGIGIYILIRGKLKELFNNRAVWISILSSVCVIGLYYIGRNILNPGYLAVVWREELAGRFGNPIGAVNHEFLYYWDWLRNFRFQKWVYYLPFSFISYFLVKDRAVKRAIIYFYVLTVSYFFIISYSQTKQLWYDAQLYPLMSILVATLIISLIVKSPLIFKPLLIFVLCFYLQRYIRTNIAYIYRPDLEKSNSCYKYGYTFRKYPTRFKEYVGIDSNENYCMPFHFYLLKEGLRSHDISVVRTGEKVFTCDSSIIESVEKRFETVKTFDEDGCWGIRVGKPHQLLTPGV